MNTIPLSVLVDAAEVAAAAGRILCISNLPQERAVAERLAESAGRLRAYLSTPLSEPVGIEK